MTRDCNSDILEELCRPVAVPINTIDQTVVDQFSKIMAERAQDYGIPLGDVKPFKGYGLRYSTMIREVRTKSPKGLDFYRFMVNRMPDFFCFN